jgi:hypothetical protein
MSPKVINLNYFAFSFLAAVCPATSTGQTNEYKNERYDYSIIFPKNWSINKGNAGQNDKIKATNSSNNKNSSDYGEIDVIVFNNVPARMLQTMMEEDINIARSVYKSFQVAKNQATILNKNNAFVVELLIPLTNNQQARILNYGIADKGNLYFIRCFAAESLYKKSGDQIRASCGSFKIGLH